MDENVKRSLKRIARFQAAIGVEVAKIEAIVSEPRKNGLSSEQRVSLVGRRNGKIKPAPVGAGHRLITNK